MSNQEEHNLSYRGYKTLVSYSPEDHCWYGQIDNIDD